MTKGRAAESARRLGAHVESCVSCSTSFVVGVGTHTVERDAPGGVDGYAYGGYACSFECAKAKVDSLPDGYVWLEGKRGGEPLYEKKSDAQVAAERLGAKLMRCAQCSQLYVFDPDESYSVMTNAPGGDYDDGNSEIVFCCSHACASKNNAAQEEQGTIWRNGKCGGTLLPSLEEP